MISYVRIIIRVPRHARVAWTSSSFQRLVSRSAFSCSVPCYTATMIRTTTIPQFLFWDQSYCQSSSQPQKIKKDSDIQSATFVYNIHIYMYNDDKIFLLITQNLSQTSCWLSKPTKLDILVNRSYLLVDQVPQCCFWSYCFAPNSKMASGIHGQDLDHLWISYLSTYGLVLGINVKLRSSSFQRY